MRLPLNQLVLLFCMGTALLGGCAKERSCEDCVVAAAANLPPIARAGSDQQTTLPKDSIVLNGTASADPDGSIVAYRWTRLSGAGGTIVQADAGQTLVRGLATGTYRFELQVRDNSGAAATDTVQVTVTGTTRGSLTPVAQTMPDQTITWPVHTIILDGTFSYDPDGTIVAYQWKQASGTGPSNIFNYRAATTIVRDLVKGLYGFELTVTDNDGLSGKDTVYVTVN